MLTLITGGEILDPAPRGVQSLLLVNDRIEGIGDYDRGRLAACGLHCEVVDARGCVVLPGLIDPHVHFLGGGGEGGFATRTPELQLSELLRGGVTTAVGCLGTDGVTRHMTALLAKARALTEEGISTYIYTGNYHLPTPTITGSIRSDVIIIDKIIGAGEIAISDHRSSQPTADELAKVVSEAAVGGLLSGKAGVTHFHTGSGKQRLRLLHTLLDQYEIRPDTIYATHINRSNALVDDAIALAERGAYVDIDAADVGLGKWARYYRHHGGIMERLTFSSDGNGSNPKMDEQGQITSIEHTNAASLFREFVASIHEYGFSLEEVLPSVTANTADVLKLRRKGRLQAGLDADVMILRKDSLELVHLFAMGRQMVKYGEVVVHGMFE